MLERVLFGTCRSYGSELRLSAPRGHGVLSTTLRTPLFAIAGGNSRIYFKTHSSHLLTREKFFIWGIRVSASTLATMWQPPAAIPAIFYRHLNDSHPRFIRSSTMMLILSDVLMKAGDKLCKDAVWVILSIRHSAQPHAKTKQLISVKGDAT